MTNLLLELLSAASEITNDQIKDFEIILIPVARDEAVLGVVDKACQQFYVLRKNIIDEYNNWKLTLEGNREVGIEIDQQQAADENHDYILKMQLLYNLFWYSVRYDVKSDHDSIAIRKDWKVVVVPHRSSDILIGPYSFNL